MTYTTHAPALTQSPPPPRGGASGTAHPARPLDEPAPSLSTQHSALSTQPRVLVITDHLPHDLPSLASLLARPDFKFLLAPLEDAPARLADKTHDTFSAALLLAPPDTLHASSRALVKVLDALVANHLPALLLTYTESDRRLAEELCAADGIMAISTACPSDELAGRLAGLVAARPLITALQRENAALRQCDASLASRLSQFDEELRLAARLQSDFFPRTLPTVGPASFDVFFRPAGHVSGDIYDVSRLDEHHLGFFVADAVGHGMPAALLTIFLKRSLKTKEITPTGYRLVPPHEALARLNNDLVAQELSNSQFLTIAYALLDTRSLTLTWSRAGHPQPLLLRPDGSSGDLELDGALLGVFPDEQFPSQTLQLHKGDALLLYTDGFESAFTDPENPTELINEHYRKEFAQLAGSNPRAAFQKMTATLDAQSGSLHQRDDLTALLLTIRPAGVCTQ